MKIKSWFKSQQVFQRELQLSAEDAFKSFDIDFDGTVGRDDLKQALIGFIKISPKDISEVRLSRLMSLLSFQKNNYLTISDFEVLLSNLNNFT